IERTISPGNSSEKLRSCVLGLAASASSLNFRCCAIPNTTSGFVTSITSSRLTSFKRSRTSTGYSLASELRLSSASGAESIAAFPSAATESNPTACKNSASTRKSLGSLTYRPIWSDFSIIRRPLHHGGTEARRKPSSFFLIFSVPPWWVNSRSAFLRAILRKRRSHLCNPTSDLLPSFEHRRTFFQKRRRSFLLILSGAADAKQSRLEKQPLGQSHLHPFVDRLHSVPHRQRSVGDDLSRNRFRARNQFRRRSHFIHQPNPMRCLRRDHPPGQHPLNRDPLPHHPRQPLRPAVSRDNPQLHLRLPQLRVVAGKTHGASESQFAPAAKRKSVNASNHGLAEVLDQVEHRLPPVPILLAGHRVLLRQLANIRARNKSLLARAGQDGHADRGVGLNVGERRPQLFHSGHVERVQHLRTVDGDVGDGVFLFEENVFVVHRIRIT